mmetsp:Transcript_56341/g.92608  ORF Transcript_56341/g.92608 Transcript_56341/m.92608 type:complete len:200 (+) Transcript_56341:931-1530(+)
MVQKHRVASCRSCATCYSPVKPTRSLHSPLSTVWYPTSPWQVRKSASRRTTEEVASVANSNGGHIPSSRINILGRVMAPTLNNIIITPHTTSSSISPDSMGTMPTTQTTMRTSSSMPFSTTSTTSHNNTASHNPTLPSSNPVIQRARGHQSSKENRSTAQFRRRLPHQQTRKLRTESRSRGLLTMKSTASRSKGRFASS